MKKIIESIAKIAINDYLKVVVKNSKKCQNCQLNENHICYIACGCVANDFKYFKKR